MARFALEIHPDDAAKWKAMTGRDETRPYDMSPLHSIYNILVSAERNGVRVTGWREIAEEDR